MNAEVAACDLRAFVGPEKPCERGARNGLEFGGQIEQKGSYAFAREGYFDSIFKDARSSKNFYANDVIGHDFPSCGELCPRAVYDG